MGVLFMNDKHHEIIIAGMGGQGVMVIGQLLAHAALLEGLNVVWFPSYGPETRGGTADCTVIISSEEIGSPVSSNPDALIALSQIMLDRFSPKVKHEGLILVNTSLAAPPKDRADCKIVEIPANDVANDVGNPKAANMVMLGAYVQLAKPVKLDSIKASMAEVLPERYHHLISVNCAALERGAELVS